MPPSTDARFAGLRSSCAGRRGFCFWFAIGENIFYSVSLMARTRTESGDVFSFVELAVAGGLSKSTYQFLEKSQLLQDGIEDFKRVATIGALVAGGVSLMGAAAMAKTIVKLEFNQEDGEAPSGIEELFITEFADGEAGLSYSQFNEYWFHRKLYEFGIRPGQKA